MFVFKSLNGLAPTYLDALVKRHTSTRSLRSSDQQLLTIPRARLKLKVDRAFSVAAPKLWNLLPVSIRSAQTISSFKLLLKTYLLTQAFNLSECWVLCSIMYLWKCFLFVVFWLFGFLLLYSTLGNNSCIILCYRIKMKWKKIYIWNEMKSLPLVLFIYCLWRNITSHAVVPLLLWIFRWTDNCKCELFL